jgi:outer membrane immunogenic protein
LKRLATAIATIALLGTPAFAADMAVKAPPPAPAPVPTWTGLRPNINLSILAPKTIRVVALLAPTGLPASFNAAFRDQFNAVRLGLNYRF